MSRDELRDVGSYALRLANVGFDVHMIQRALLSHPAILEVQERRGATRAKGAAQRKAAWAVEYVARNPVTEWQSRIPARIVAYREVADSHPWMGRTGPTDRRVLEAFFLSATFAKSTKFRFAARTATTTRDLANPSGLWSRRIPKGRSLRSRHHLQV